MTAAHKHLLESIHMYMPECFSEDNMDDEMVDIVSRSLYREAFGFNEEYASPIFDRLYGADREYVTFETMAEKYENIKAILDEMGID